MLHFFRRRFRRAWVPAVDGRRVDPRLRGALPAAGRRGPSGGTARHRRPRAPRSAAGSTVRCFGPRWHASTARAAATRPAIVQPALPRATQTSLRRCNRCPRSRPWRSCCPRRPSTCTCASSASRTLRCVATGRREAQRTSTTRLTLLLVPSCYGAHGCAALSRALRSRFVCLHAALAPTLGPSARRRVSCGRAAATSSPSCCRGGLSATRSCARRWAARTTRWSGTGLRPTCARPCARGTPAERDCTRCVAASFGSAVLRGWPRTRVCVRRTVSAFALRLRPRAPTRLNHRHIRAPHPSPHSPRRCARRSRRAASRTPCSCAPPRGISTRCSRSSPAPHCSTLTTAAAGTTAATWRVRARRGAGRGEPAQQLRSARARGCSAAAMPLRPRPRPRRAPTSTTTRCCGRGGSARQRSWR